jgi:oxygen-dependent protoporphyrinogen oxidase
MDRENHTDTIIIGAGITGLTAAFYLNRMKRDFRVLEEKERVGGVIQTIHENGFLYETGPNTGVLGQPEAALLFEDLGKDAELEIADEAVKKRYILKNGNWEKLPSGLFPAIKTPLFALKDKIRILAEPFRARGSDPEESLEELVLRRMGRSYLEYAVDPFILGVYAGDPGALIPKYALPKLYNLEQHYGSFIGGAIRKKFEKKSDLDRKASREVFSFKGGFQSLVDALYKQAGPERFNMNLNDISIQNVRESYKITYSSEGKKVGEYYANNVILTTGAHKLSPLLPFVEPDQLRILSDMRYAKVMELTIGFKKWEGRKLDGFGGLIPFKEKRDLLGILFPSAFLSGRAPEGGALFTIFMGGIRRPELFEKPEQEIFAILEREFKDLMGVDDFKPDLLKIFRHKWAIPQYEKSSGERFRMISEIENEHKGIFLRGNFSGGIGLADRIRQGRKVAEEIIDR